MAGPQSLTLADLVVERRDAGGVPLRILDIPALTVSAGERVGVAGPSGAGKSTFLEIVSGLTTPTRGRVLWGETDIASLREGPRDRWRHRTIGFVFQEFHLIPELSALANVLLPARFGRIGADMGTRARMLLDRVRLADPHRPAAVLSRGEQQRVAIARALLASPALILADEPTASLDAETGREVSDLLLASARESGATLLVVSHDPLLLAGLDRTIRLRGGQADNVSPEMPA